MKNILVCVDFSDTTQLVLNAATEQAKATGAKVRLLHVAPLPEIVMYSPGTAMVHPSAAVATETHPMLAKLKLLANQMPIPQVEIETREGYAVNEIMAEAIMMEADMIIMGSHGHSALYELMAGSVTEGVLRRSQVPVLVVPSQKK